MTAQGANRRRLVVKLAGGAAVLGAANAERFRIGERNIQAVRERLERAGLRVLKHDTGGNSGRTLELHANDGRVLVRTAALPAVEL
jgi:chemotaxis protein CheD